MKEKKLIKKVTYTHSDFEFYNGKLLIVRCNDNFHFDNEDFKQILDDLSKLKEKYKVMIVLGKYTTVSKELREFRATPEGTKFSIAEAVVIKSLAHRLLINFYININKPKVPTKLFIGEEEALNWLEKYIN